MPKAAPCLVLAMLGCLILPPAALAQRTGPPPPVDSTAVVAIRLTDGSELVGRVMAVDDTSLTVLTSGAGRVVVLRSSIASWRALRGRATAQGFRPRDPNTTRLFFGPTARTLDQGDGYFADYYLFFTTVGYGVHDRVTVTGGISIIPGASNQLIYFGAKAGLVRGPKAALAVGGTWMTATGGGGGSLGSGYAAATLGTEDNAVSLMAGYPFTTDNVAPEPMFMLGGETRIGSRSKLLVETWKLPDAQDVPIIFGIRWFGDRLAVDFGFVYVTGSDLGGWPFFPWVDFVVNW